MGHLGGALSFLDDLFNGVNLMGSTYYLSCATGVPTGLGTGSTPSPQQGYFAPFSGFRTRYGSTRIGPHNIDVLSAIFGSLLGDSYSLGDKKRFFFIPKGVGGCGLDYGPAHTP